LIAQTENADTAARRANPKQSDPKVTLEAKQFWGYPALIAQTENADTAARRANPKQSDPKVTANKKVRWQSELIFRSQRYLIRYKQSLLAPQAVARSQWEGPQ
jgi:hypothetical protein